MPPWSKASRSPTASSPEVVSVRKKRSLEELNPEHRAALQRRFNDVVVLHDHSWGDTDTTVLEVEADGQHCIVKTFGPDNHHFEREAQAHREFTTPLLAA